MVVNDNRALPEMQLAALYEVCSILNHSLDYQTAVEHILPLLHEKAMLETPMLALKVESGEQLELNHVYIPEQGHAQRNVQYKPGEGIIGTVLSSGQSIVIPLISEDFRFTDKLELYNWGKPFIAVPVKSGGKEIIGVLAAQPDTQSPELLSTFNQFMEMCANLIGQKVTLSRDIVKQQTHLQTERDQLRHQMKSNYRLDNLVGHSQSMKQIYEQIRMVSKWDSTVLLRGESGTGKELIANAIHYNSSRVSGPFIKLNCAALPDSLLESELFGHEKGAFTGAIKQRKGRFEMADGGTLFLDEIGEITPAFQAKLLRVLQEGEFERVGGTKTYQVDVRIIAATHRNLEQGVQSGDFREDLYYRLNVMPIYPPTLRARIEDLPELADFLLTKLAKQQNRELSLTKSAIRQLMKYDWPGNVRQLENMLERAAIMSETGVIDQDLVHQDQPGSNPITNQSITQNAVPMQGVTLDPDMDERERVVAALEQSGWVQAKAARLLNMTPRQIAYRVQTMNIRMRQL